MSEDVRDAGKYIGVSFNPEYQPACTGGESDLEIPPDPGSDRAGGAEPEESDVLILALWRRCDLVHIYRDRYWFL